jgi:hypothetical protein
MSNSARYRSCIIVVLAHSPPSVHTARAIYEFARTQNNAEFSGKKSLWLASCVLEKEFGTPETFDQMLQAAVKACPKVTRFSFIATCLT